MHDYTRHEQAKKLRGKGLTFKEIGEQFGVSPERIRQLIVKLDQKERKDRQAKEISNAPKPWWHGLKKETAKSLIWHGFTSRDSCLVFAADNLIIYRGSVDFGEDFESGGQKFTTKGIKKFPLSQVNEVRLWLGHDPISKGTRS